MILLDILFQLQPQTPPDTKGYGSSTSPKNINMMTTPIKNLIYCHAVRHFQDMAEPRQKRKQVSLRHWLDRTSRHVHRHECLHIFCQVVEIVDLAHAQGVAVGNVRPSCFVLSDYNRVEFIESGSDSGSGSGEEGSGFGGRNVGFPLKQILCLEDEWYTSPEEDSDGGGRFVKDVYQLGVLLFELFCTFESMDQKLKTMSNLRHRVLPTQMLLEWSKEASFCLWLLHPQPHARPKMSDILRSEFLKDIRNNMEEQRAMISLKEEIDDQELLLQFLLHSKKNKQEVADNLYETVTFLSTDIDEVKGQQSNLQSIINTYPELENDEYSETEKVDHIEDTTRSYSRKRFRPTCNDYKIENQTKLVSDTSAISKSQLEYEDSTCFKNSRLMKNFAKFEAAYLSTRSRLINQGTQQHASKEGQGGKRKNEWINPFLDGLHKYLSFSKLKVRAELKQGDLLNSSNLVCSLVFDRDKEFFAIAGANRKTKIFDCDTILNEVKDIHYPVAEMRNKSRVSCLSWNNYIKSQIAGSDFEGAVQVWDVTRGQVLVEMREHERRIWSVDFSPSDPTKLASGSDDGTVKLWNTNQAGSTGTIRTTANVCSVQFSPDPARSIAVGSADHNVYCYDLRNLKFPSCTMIGHSKTVSYVKYLDSSSMVSSSTDGSIKLWDLTMSTSRIINDALVTFTGHTNAKNFVGLSVYDGYIATGSETNEVYVYQKAFPMPVLSYKFETFDPITGAEVDDDTSQFISSVCWRGQSSTLLAANSSGDIKLLEMV